MQTMRTIDKQKATLIKRLRKISNDSITFLSTELNVPYCKVWRWFRKDKISDKSILIICNSKYSKLVNKELSTYIYDKFSA